MPAVVTILGEALGGLYNSRYIFCMGCILSLLLLLLLLIFGEVLLLFILLSSVGDSSEIPYWISWAIRGGGLMVSYSLVLRHSDSTFNSN